MPSLPVISGREAVRAFERDEWRLTRQSGSHLILTKQGIPVVLSIPNHRTLRRGTLRSLIRKAGLTIEEFVGLLNE